jgi:uncharacterized protein YqeY
MVKAAMQNRINDSKTPLEVDDKLWVEVIASYVKKLDKSAEEYKKVGERGQEKLTEIDGEKAFLKPFLPTQIEGEELAAIISQVVESTGANSPKDTGRVMGAIMKDYKGRVNSKMVKNLVAEALN